MSKMNEEHEPLIGTDALASQSYRDSTWKRSSRIVYSPLRVSSAVMLGIVALAILWLFISLTKPASASLVDIEPITPLLTIPAEVQRSWAQYSPYFAAGEYTKVPNGCSITQVNIIQRHGARFPTSNAGAQIQAAVSKLQSVQKFNDPRLNFLRNFTYDLGHDDLVAFGAAQSFDAGQFDLVRYKDLISTKNLPFVRAASSSRVVQSATNWTAGFTFASHNRLKPILNVVLDEALNNTLDDNMCPNAGSADPQTDAWQTVYAAPISARLAAAAPGANLTLDDISNLVSLCPFETVAKERPSPFCLLFDQTDFDGFEYFGDLNKFYGTGYGQALGPVQGVGYINELLARLTGKPVRDHTQTNHTLDNSPITFPLNRTLYIDFSHDNQMIAIYSALGLFHQTRALDPIHPDPQRTWLASKLVPFSAKFVTERLECGQQTFVRMLVDDALQDLDFCGANKDSLCTLDDFVESQGFARSDGAGDFEKCFD